MKPAYREEGALFFPFRRRQPAWPPLPLFFTDKNPGQDRDYFPAAFHLLAGFIKNAVEKFQPAVHHPGRGPSDMPPGGEVKDGAHGHHNPPLKMGAQPVHEYFLLGSAQGNPDDVRQVFIDSPGNSRVVKFIHRAERQFLKRHVLHAGIFPFQGPAKGIQRLAVSSQEHHSVFFMPMASLKIWAPQYWGLSACSSHFR